MTTADLCRVRTYARRFAVARGRDIDDCESAATWGYVLAGKAYKPSKGDFWTYARMRMWGCMMDLLVPKSTAPSGAPATLPSSTDAIDVREALDALPEDRRQVLEGIYVEGLSARVVAVHRGVHESRISQIRKDALARMRVALGDGYAVA